MQAVIELWMDLPGNVRDSISRAMEVESISAPEGGEVNVDPNSCGYSPWLKMTSNDLSTIRAMLNSYTGLLSAAIAVSIDE